jgi:hypothetical protein
VLIIGGVLAGVAAVVLVVSSLTGGSSTSSAPSAASSAAGGASNRALSPAQMNVAVLNGTSTNGLAHLVSGELRQNGYSRAAPLTGHPPGANQLTAVQYASGHRADAQAVARSLGVAQVKPIEAGVASLSRSATVVVIVGADRASSGAGAESSGTGAESSAGGGESAAPAAAAP